MADEQSRLPDSVDAPGSAGPEPEPSRPGDAHPARRPAREPGGLALPRSATMKLPDASRDPSCVRAHDGPASPQPETATPRGGFRPVRTTQKLGTVPVWSAAAQSASGPAGKETRAQQATPDLDEAPPRSVRRSRPWAEVPDPNGAGIRVIAELEAASRDLDSVPMEPIPRLNARGRSPESLRLAGRRAKQARAAMIDPDDSAPQKTQLDSDDEIEPHRISKRPGPFSTNRAVASAGYIGAAFVVIAVGLWIWNASTSPPRGADPRDNPTPATAGPVTTGATRVESTTNPGLTPPPTTAAATAPSLLPNAVPSSTPTLLPTPMGSVPLRGRPPKPPKGGHEIVDPWDK